MAKIGVLGSGTWGTALTIHLAGIGHEVTLWSAFQNEIDALNSTYKHVNLPGSTIPRSVRFTSDLAEACADKALIVLAVPSIFTRGTVQKMKTLIKPGQVLVNVAKGIEEDTLLTQSELTKEELPEANVGALCGPSHAEEVSLGVPTAVCAGAADRATAEFIQSIFMGPKFRVYTGADVVGMEVGSSLKNVIALAAGMADGLGCGDNTLAALITRGVKELAQLGTAMGCRHDTFYGLTGLGDLIVTCQSKHSRNRRAGQLMGQGWTMEAATKEVGQVVEGIYSAKAGLALGRKYSVDIPIIEETNRVLFEDKPASKALDDLMTRNRTMEYPGIVWEA